MVGDVEVTEQFERTYVCDVDPTFGFEHATVKLTIPSVPLAARPASFAEHVVGTGTVLGVLVGGVVLSTDLGRNWRHIELDGAPGLDFVNCFTTSEGHRLLQVKSSSDDREPKDPGGAILRYDAKWNLIERTRGGRSRWHGTASIDQGGDTIMWAEYPNNAAKYEAGSEHLAVRSRVFRSRDGGSSWEVVFEQNGLDIRHFHTLVADRHVDGQWWLSSGDLPAESRVWVSRDNGENWEEVTNPAPDVDMHPQARPSLLAVHRYTDIWLGEDELLWGADDWLDGDYEQLWGPDGRLEPGMLVHDGSAPPLGARIFRSPRSFPLRPRDVGWIGNPVRSITDLGEALLVTTEGKRELRPQVCLVSKNGSDIIQQLFTIDVLRDTGGSGFTYSKASRAAEEGTFFSYRASHDLAPLATRILKWELELG
jgi:hypothetical protein